MHSWGSQANSNSGIHSFIRNKYGLSFRRFSDGSFSHVCKLAVKELNALGIIEPCFDYMFIDESQDFDENFIAQCEMVTSKQVYVAGDIFQNIFDTDQSDQVETDYLLNKCYRTDPRTFMFAHSMGMGLCEKPIIRWLDDDQWQRCGYDISRNEGKFIANRAPLRRYGDDDNEIQERVRVKLCDSEPDSCVRNIINAIAEIKKDNPDVQPEDICVVFLSMGKSDYNIATRVAYEIMESFLWESNELYSSKMKTAGKVAITNTNNVKGLEFPFVICVETGTIGRYIRTRNAIYMMLTRSFIKSYFIMGYVNQNLYEVYSSLAAKINQHGCLELRAPAREEKKQSYDTLNTFVS